MQLHKTAGLAAVIVTALASGACATKKHVREAIAPVQKQVGDIDKRTGENKTAIGDLDRQVATADEKATDAGKRAGQGIEAASAAQRAAQQAASQADAANGLAQQAQQGVSRLDRSLQNLDNYKLLDTKQVFFPVGRSNLDKQALSELDAALMSLGNLRNYVIEVQGFADKSGSKNMNLELSRMRADAVVRYLSVDHSVPLRDIRQLGIGSEFPNAVNKTKVDRKNNRRVDVKIYALDMTGGGTNAGSNSADRARQ